MKKLLLIFYVAALFLTAYHATAQGLSDADRKASLKYLKDTRVALKKSVAGLSEEQVKFKPTPESWNIAECVEHLGIVEGALFGAIQQSIIPPADPARRSDVKQSDSDIWNLISSRSAKVKTNEAFVPSGKYSSFKETLAAFEDSRSKTTEYVKSTKDDFRNHYYEFPFGTTDIHQVVVFMAGHTDRHTQQIEEVKADPNFPKKKL